MVNKELFLNTPVNPIVLGLTGSAYGIHGWIRVFSFTEKTEDIFEYQPWFIQRSDQWKQLKLEAWKHHKQDILIKIKHIDDRNAANSMLHWKIIIDSVQLPILKGSEFYWKDLIGCQIITTQGYNLGYVQNLMETGSNDVLIVKANVKDAFGVRERLIPFLYEQVIKNIDLTAKIIEVDWDPGF